MSNAKNMDIKDFVKESLMQIAESINDVNVELEEKSMRWLELSEING